MSRPHVVIVGGGFGGLNAARALATAPVDMTVIDRTNFHLFQPLLYQVATAALSIGEIAVPIRSVLRSARNTRVVMAEVRGIDLAARTLDLGDQQLGYDYLVLAPGSSHSYFENEDWEPFAPGLKSVDDAFEIRRRIFTAFENAERAVDADARQALLTFVIVGAGPTGSELAGALAEIAGHTLARDFRLIDPRSARVVLLEGGERVLPTFPPDLSEKARRQLERLGVEVRTGAQVTSVDAGGVTLGEERIPAATVVWAAGVSASPLLRSLGLALDRAGRVATQSDLTLPGYPEVYVIGDAASFEHQGGRPLPGVAQVAIQQGKAAARNIERTIGGRDRLAFHYRDKGNMATLGRAAAVADFGRVRLSGLAAWLTWLFVHVLFLIGFANRVQVMVRWVWSYFTYERGARLITGNPAQSRPATSEGELGPAIAAR